MTLPRRRLLQIVAGLAVLPSLPRQASADVYPSRPVHVVVGFAPAGGADVLARILGKRLAEVLGQQVIVENVTGAGGMVGASRVARSEPNGYQIFVGSTADAINVSLYKRPLYDLRADLMPVVLIADQPAVLLARSDFPASNLQEFIAYIKKKKRGLDQVRIRRRWLLEPPGLRTVQRRNRCQRDPCALSRRWGGDARPDRRPRRLHLYAQRCGFRNDRRTARTSLDRIPQAACRERDRAKCNTDPGDRAFD